MTNLRIDQPVWCSIHRLTARAANTIVRWASYISVRQLHRVFEREGVSFGAWLREQRLRRCQDDLTSPQLSHHTIAQIAVRWGFPSAAHFTRTFQARFGISPAEFRRHASTRPAAITYKPDQIPATHPGS